MAFLKIQDILKATGGNVLCGEQGDFTGVSIDSRTIRDSELFVALKGPRFDGHEYLAAALKTGGGAVVSARTAEKTDRKTIILVDDTLKALQALGRHMRLKLGIPVVAVTGTNGKTTTKELVSSIFGIRHKVLKTSGNLNNHIGLPLCMARMNGSEGIMVLEMGSNAPGDIRLLCDMALPDYAVMTNVGPAHLEGFGSLEAVRATDLEVLEYVKVFAANADDRFLMSGISNFGGKVITYGIDNRADVTAGDIELKEKGSSFFLRLADGSAIGINLRLSGRFNISNALAAASVASAAGASSEEIREGLEAFDGVPMRLEIRRTAGMLVISDVYNANPASMSEAIRELVRLGKGRTIAVLGDMLELGRYAEEMHLDLVRLLNDLKVDMLIGVGQEMKKAAGSFRGDCYTTDDSMEAGAILSDISRDGDTVLVKGSRGMQMERAVAELETALSSGGGSAV